MKKNSSLDQPLVSIIMKCYNCEQFLREALDSVYAQTYQNWHIIFWDNCSTDASADIAQSYDGRLHYFYANSNTPLGSARKLALKHVEGEYIAFLDCDDQYMPKKLERQVRLMEEKSLVFSYSSVEVMNQKGEKVRTINMRNRTGSLIESLLYKYEVNMQTVMFRRHLLEQEWCFFDDSLSYSPDYNLFMRIAARYPIGVLTEVLVRYRVFSGSLSRKMLGMVSKEMKYTLDQLLKDLPSLGEDIPDAFTFAYDKLHYYDAIYEISQNNYPQAKRHLFSVRFQSLQYLILYLLVLVRVPNSVLLHLLRR